MFDEPKVSPRDLQRLDATEMSVSKSPPSARPAEKYVLSAPMPAFGFACWLPPSFPKTKEGATVSPSLACRSPDYSGKQPSLSLRAYHHLTLLHVEKSRRLVH
eukprot:scaffold39953_cov266-Skeletonema_dohrnii-CCMP3373.AAC.1